MSIQDLLMAAQVIDHSQTRKHATLGKRGTEMMIRHNDVSDDDVPQRCPQAKRQKRNSGASNSSSNRSSPHQGPTRSKRGSVNRVVHNQLEKTRRAQLRTGLERLSELMPSASDSTRHTTLGLLTRTRNHILSDGERVYELERRHEQVQAEHERLLARLDVLLPGSSQSALNSCVRISQPTSSSSVSVASESTLSADGNDIADLASLGEDEDLIASMTLSITSCQSPLTPPCEYTPINDAPYIKRPYVLSSELLAQGLLPVAPRVSAYLPGLVSCSNHIHDLLFAPTYIHSFETQTAA